MGPETMNTFDEPKKIWNPAFVGVLISNFLLYTGQYICNTLVPKYADYLGATSTAVGAVSSLFALSALIFKFISSPAIDTFNKKYVLAIGMAAVGIAFLAYSVSATVPELVAARLVQGAGQAFTATCCLALAADSLPADKLGTGIGYFSLTQVACMAIAPTLGLKLAETLGYTLVFIFSALCLFAGAFTAVHIKNHFIRTKKFHVSLKGLIAKEALLPAVLMFFLCGANGSIVSFLVIYAEDQGIGTDIGYFFTVNAVALFFICPTVGKMADKRGGIKYMLTLSLLCFGIAFAIISFSDRLWIILIAALFYTSGYGASLSLIQSLCMKLVPEERRGAGSCTYFIGKDIGNLSGSVMAGVIADHLGYEAMWRMEIIPVAMAIAVFLLFGSPVPRHAWSNTG